MIYISTGGFNTQTFVETTEILSNHGIDKIELSGGKPCPGVEQSLWELAQKNQLVLHNYFPPPQRPFVFNLASLNKEIINLSIEHARYAIELSHLIGVDFYSFHAGFLIDPGADEIGNKLNIREVNNRREALNVFIDNVNRLSEYAKERGVKLLIENNVLSNANFKEFGVNPLLMTDHGETSEILKRTTSNVGLLIDVAHLKVSSASLNFDKADYLIEFSEHTCGYHLSDNDGTEDSNQKLTQNSWFWPHIRRDLSFYSLEVYREPVTELVAQRDLVEQIIGN